jgi:probable phosphoglycerate mutase
MLARHGSCAQTENVLVGRLVDAPLDARGEREALSLAARLEQEHPVLVLTSPRLRARQTAAAIADYAGCPVRAVAELDEMDFGEWSGRRFSELAHDTRWQRWNAARASSLTPAGDGIVAVQRRITRYLDELAAAFTGCTLALVTHAEIIRSALLAYLDVEIDDWQTIEIAPASLTALCVTRAGVEVESVGLRCTCEEHLAA